jgi:hypothetical protein
MSPSEIAGRQLSKYEVVDAYDVERSRSGRAGSIEYWFNTVDYHGLGPCALINR